MIRLFVLFFSKAVDRKRRHLISFWPFQLVLLESQNSFLKSVADFDKEGGEASEDEDEVGDVDEGVVAAVDDGTTLEEIEVQ